MDIIENDGQIFESKSFVTDVKPVICDVLGSVILLDEDESQKCIQEANQAFTTPHVNTTIDGAKDKVLKTTCSKEKLRKNTSPKETLRKSTCHV